MIQDLRGVLSLQYEKHSSGSKSSAGPGSSSNSNSSSGSSRAFISPPLPSDDLVVREAELTARLQLVLAEQEEAMGR